MLESKVKFGEVHDLTSLIEYGSDRVNFQSIFSNENGGVVLVAFKAGQQLAQHTAPAELMVNVLEGEIEFTVVDHPHILHAGEFLLVGEGVAHSVLAKADSKMMLVKVKA